MQYPDDKAVKDLLEEALTHDFGGLATDFRRLCLNELDMPVGSKHPEYLDRLFQQRLDQSSFNEFLISYIYLAASCFAMDRVCDGQSSDLDDILCLPQLVLAAAKRLRSVFSAIKNVEDENVSAMFTEFRAAMKIENKVRNSVLLREPALEVKNLTQRSILFVDSYVWLSRIRNIVPSDEDVAVLKDFVFFMQRGDDLGDWREDHKAGNKTYFLRRCYEHVSLSCDESELEEFVYFGGAYEQEAQMVISGLTDISIKLSRKENSEYLIAFVDKQKDRAKSVLENFKRVKGGDNLGDISKLYH